MSWSSRFTVGASAYDRVMALWFQKTVNLPARAYFRTIAVLDARPDEVSTRYGLQFGPGERYLRDSLIAVIEIAGEQFMFLRYLDGPENEVDLLAEQSLSRAPRDQLSRFLDVMEFDPADLLWRADRPGHK